MKTKNINRRRARSLYGAGVALVSLAAVSCSVAEAPAAEAAAAQIASTTHVIEIEAFQFSPQSLTVAEGDTIIWRNLDVVPHTATAGDGAWDSGNLNNQDEWSFVAGDAGVWDYICTFHPSMTGTIIVTEN